MLHNFSVCICTCFFENQTGKIKIIHKSHSISLRLDYRPFWPVNIIKIRHSFGFSKRIQSEQIQNIGIF